MNDSQDKKYWRRWSAVVRANQWRWLDGRLVDAARGDVSEDHAAVWRIARELAGAAHRAPIANDLRHACHIHAVGRDISHLKMTDPQFDRLLILWGDERDLLGLLVEPDDLNSVMAWIDPKEYQRKCTVKYIRQLAPEAVIISIAARAGYGDNWESLTRDQLLALGRIIRDRNNPHRPPRREKVNQPF